MIETLVFLCALIATFAAAWRWGGNPEKRTIEALGAVWIASLLAVHYFPAGAMLWILGLTDFLAAGAIYYRWQRRWQTIVVYLFAPMIGLHLAQHVSPIEMYLYLSALTVLAYMQLAVTFWASCERSRERLHGKNTRLAAWSVARHWLLGDRLLGRKV